MILVTVGASQYPFDRLLRAVVPLTHKEQLVVQHGPSRVRPSGARCLPFLPLDALTQLIREARVVVTHAGVGSILLSLENGKRPYVVPRLRAFGETIDDHQLECARRFAHAGAVTLVEDPACLAEVIAGAEATSREEAAEPGGAVLPLVQDLRDYLESVVRPACLEVLP